MKAMTSIALGAALILGTWLTAPVASADTGTRVRLAGVVKSFDEKEVALFARGKVVRIPRKHFSHHKLSTGEVAEIWLENQSYNKLVWVAK